MLIMGVSEVEISEKKTKIYLWMIYCININKCFLKAWLQCQGYYYLLHLREEIERLND